MSELEANDFLDALADALAVRMTEAWKPTVDALREAGVPRKDIYEFCAKVTIEHGKMMRKLGSMTVEEARAWAERNKA